MPPGMTAGEYGRSVRAHWGIENSIHWVLDIAFREDESRIRAGNAAENMNMARHIGVNLLKQEEWRYVFFCFLQSIHYIL